MMTDSFIQCSKITKKINLIYSFLRNQDFCNANANANAVHRKKSVHPHVEFSESIKIRFELASNSLVLIVLSLIIRFKSFLIILDVASGFFMI